MVLWLMATPGVFAEPSAHETPRGGATDTEIDQEKSESTTQQWHYGAYLDLSYSVDFNFPDNRRWRSKVTTQRVNELTPNMVLGYVRKDADEGSRWGMEFAVQGGYDVTGQVPNASLRYGSAADDADAFSHFARANVSYLAPIGTGLKLTAGLFNSFIGYESFYAKDNRYNYLSYPNNLPSYGTRVQWTASPAMTLTQNFYYGPDQSNTDLRYWRFFSDSSIQWKQDNVTVALVYDVGTERAIPQVGGQRVFWTGTALYTHWQCTRTWALAVRPELYYDPDGAMTGARQFIKAVTTTLEYKLLIAASVMRFRMEYRYDDSTGSQGGFFRDGNTTSGMVDLVQAQHLLIAAILWSYDSP